MENQRTQSHSDVKLGEFLGLVLRHDPDAAGITLNEHGWANVQELLAGVRRKRWPWNKFMRNRVM